jgi:hypothetical protein
MVFNKRTFFLGFMPMMLAILVSFYISHAKIGVPEETSAVFIMSGLTVLFSALVIMGQRRLNRLFAEPTTEDERANIAIALIMICGASPMTLYWIFIFCFVKWEMGMSAALASLIPYMFIFVATLITAAVVFCGVSRGGRRAMLVIKNGLFPALPAGLFMSTLVLVMMYSISIMWAEVLKSVQYGSDIYWALAVGMVLQALPPLCVVIGAIKREQDRLKWAKDGLYGA